MVTGLPVEHLIERFGDHGLGIDEECTVLTEMGLFPIACNGYAGISFWPYHGVYFITSPSLNSKGSDNHRIVIEYKDKFKVFDPQKGNKNKRYYTKKMIYEKRAAYSEITFLKPMEKHEMTQKRLMLYQMRGK
jgi:hypothetical protein